MTRILLADDVKLYLALEKTFLARADHEFLTATTGPDALHILRKERPDLAIVERSLGGIGAFEIREEMLRDPELSRIPMIVTASSGTDGMQARAEALSVSAVLMKPFKLEDLTGAVERVLPHRSRHFLRADAYLEVGVRTERQVQYFTGSALNVSAGGLLVEVGETMSLGQSVHLQFVLPTDPHMIAVRARVVRYAKEQHRSATCYGFEFLELAPADRGRIEEFVAQRLSRTLQAP